MGTWGFARRAAVGPVEGDALDSCKIDCRLSAAAGDFWIRLSGVGSQLVGPVGGFSHESEHDLALMVSDFLENGSGGADSMYSSDSDSSLSDLPHLAEKISFFKRTVNQYESDLLSVVHSLVHSVKEADLDFVKSGPCNASCIRFSLVKLLRSSGYDAAVCASKWQGYGKVPGGDHEYIDVATHNDAGIPERMIIDIDFRSHFEIARAVESYDAILNALPVVYVGTLSKLKQILQVMVEAARSSLKQNSMPFPPWRSLAFLQAKWHSSYQRKVNPDEQNIEGMGSYDHKQCIEHLWRLKSSEIEAERFLKPIYSENNRRPKLERWRHSSFRTL